MGGRRLAGKVVTLCVSYRFLRKKLEGQKMAPLPDSLAVPAPPFTHVGLDSTDYDWDIIEKSSGGKTRWIFCPSGCQWRNGAAESFVKKTKRTLAHTYGDSPEESSLHPEFQAHVRHLLQEGRGGPRLHHVSHPEHDAVRSSKL